MAKKEGSVTKKGGSMVKTIKENFVLYAAIAVVVIIGLALVVNSIGIDALASLFKGDATGGCVSYADLISQKNIYKTSSIVGASFSVNTATKTATYYFDSLVNRNPAKGVPGLIQYCIYSSTTVDKIKNIAPVAKGASSKVFLTVLKAAAYNYFGFKRDGGDENNILLNGKTGISMGSVTWTTTAPTNQTILLLITDRAECLALYGQGTPDHCYVYPIMGQQSGSITVTKYNDANKNGIQDSGEAVLAGWDIILYGGNGVQINQGVTDGNGQVKFVDLTPGNYVVKETLLPPTTHWANTDPGSNGPCIQPDCPTPSKTAIVTAGVVTQIKFGNVVLLPT